VEVNTDLVLIFSLQSQVEILLDLNFDPLSLQAHSLELVQKIMMLHLHQRKSQGPKSKLIEPHGCISSFLSRFGNSSHVLTQTHPIMSTHSPGLKTDSRQIFIIPLYS
jgi:hypothetical protein